MKDFKVLTLNIHKGFSMGKRRFTLEKIRVCLRETGANVVFLQEVLGEHSGTRESIPNWPNNNQLEFLADSVWTHHAYGRNAIYQKGHHGNAILCEYPFISWDNIDVSVVNFSKRGILHGITSQGIHLLCTHLGLFERERRAQINKLKSYMQEKIPTDDPLILAGDFNDWRKISHRFLLDELGLQEAVELSRNKLAKTFPAMFPVLSMDRIYVRGFKVSQCQIMSAGNWRSLSDHCALLADLSLDAAQQPPYPPPELT